MKNDPAHVWTDEEIAKLEKQIAKEYKKAHKEVSKKLDDYLATFATKDEKWQEWVANGTKTEKEYKEWKKGQVLIGKHWEDLRDSLAEDYTNAAVISQNIAKGYAPGVYAVNHNYGTFEVEKGSMLDTSYTLYSREAVERMYRESPRLYPKYGKAVAKEIKLGKQMAWDKRRIQSVLMQGILQGESIPNLTKRLEHVTGGDHKAAIRNARTMMTGVQNAGRVDAYDRAKSLGIPVRKQWLATLDGRTRHWHRQLDGVIVENDEPFENEFGKIMFPGDPEADPANVYNCRCTLLAAIKGFEINVKDTSLRSDEKLGDMDYDEWLATKKSTSNPIDLPEKKAANIKGAWNAQYGKGGTIADPKHKHTAAEGKALMDEYDAAEAAKLQAQLDKLGDKEYSDIWQGKTIKVSDYADMETPIKVKHYYLDNAIAKAEKKGDAKAVAKYKAQKKSLEAFEKDGKKFLAESGQDVAKAAKVEKTAKAAEKAKKAAPAATKPKPTPTPKADPAPKTMSQAQAKKALKEAEAVMDDVKDGMWDNIWQETVTPADYAEKKGSIAAKKKYFEDKYQEAFDNHWSSKVVKFENLLEDLDEFEDLGKQYEAAKLKADAAKKVLEKYEQKELAEAKKNLAKNAKALEALDKKTHTLNILGDITVDEYPANKKFIDSYKKGIKDFKKTGGELSEAMKEAMKQIEDLEADYKKKLALDKAVEAGKKAKEADKAAKNAVKAKEAKAKLDAVGAEKIDVSFASELYYGKGLDEVNTVADYELYAKSVKHVKKSYGWQLQLAEAQGDKAQYAVVKKKLDALEDFEKKGKEYKKLNKAYQKKYAADQYAGAVAGDTYSAERKAKALWAKTDREYRQNDAVFDKHARPIHNSKSAFEHEGYYHYTWGSGPYNAPLAGFEDGFNTSGYKFKGPGKVNIDVGGYGSRIRGLTKLCEKSKQPVDFWVQSGQYQATLEGMLKLPYGKLDRMTDADLQQFVGKVEQLPQFISGAINKGGGSYTPGDMIFNIYCPKGSEALYVLEDGHFKKHEHEMILQRGGTYKITKIYWGNDTVHGGRKLIVDMELRLERGYNKFQQ